ncbi:MAG: gamma-glutamyltransferase [Alphaproteobacteria bacterium]|nr:gamma-glutamyltransferase [Alphaproteobacteria bacterium]
MRLFCLCLLVVWAAVRPAVGADTPIITYEERFLPTVSRGGMVVSQEKLASEVGAEILRQGGNAVDAAVATGFALAVTLPQAGNLAGGGFMLVYLRDEDKTIAIDYREEAPSAAHPQIFINDDGSVDEKRGRYSHQAVAVPGTVLGFVHALNKYGTMTLEQVIAPSIRLAAEGITVTYALEASLASREAFLKRNPEAAKTFFKEDGSLYRKGEVFTQLDLANTLRQIALGGERVFYTGPLAQKIVAEMERNNGLISADDLAMYRVVEREPLVADFLGHRVITMPPPSSGGVHLFQMLNMLEELKIGGVPQNSAQYYHYLVEVMRQAYADRSKYLGDPDFVDVPVETLTSQETAKQLVALISESKARRSQDVAPTRLLPKESYDTTHFSVIDDAGNIVSNTYTLNFSYGSGIVVEGTGMLLNNQMDDFSAAPGVPNGYGLIGSEANQIEPGKRPLSSMTPVIVQLKDGSMLATGSPGGSTIITVVLQTVLNVLQHEMNISAATNAPRIHHQWLPDEVLVENGISPDTVELLEKMGHHVMYRGRTLGSTQSIRLSQGFFYGASDPRRPGAAVAGVD